MPTPPVTLNTDARNAACDGATARCNVGGAGFVKICDADLNELTRAALANPAFAPAMVGNAQALGLPLLTDAATAAGVAAFYLVCENGGLLIWQGTITGIGGGGNMELDDVNVILGAKVSINTWEHQQPAS